MKKYFVFLFLLPVFSFAVNIDKMAYSKRAKAKEFDNIYFIFNNLKHIEVYGKNYKDIYFNHTNIPDLNWDISDKKVRNLTGKDYMYNLEILLAKKTCFSLDLEFYHKDNIRGIRKIINLMRNDHDDYFYVNAGDFYSMYNNTVFIKIAENQKNCKSRAIVLNA